MPSGVGVQVPPCAQQENPGLRTGVLVVYRRCSGDFRSFDAAKKNFTSAPIRFLRAAEYPLRHQPRVGAQQSEKGRSGKSSPPANIGTTKEKPKCRPSSAQRSPLQVSQLPPCSASLPVADPAPRGSRAPRLRPPHRRHPAWRRHRPRAPPPRPWIRPPTSSAPAAPPTPPRFPAAPAPSPAWPLTR